MHANHDSYPSYDWQFGAGDSDREPRLNLTLEELAKLQLDIMQNFTRLYGSSASRRGGVPVYSQYKYSPRPLTEGHK